MGKYQQSLYLEETLCVLHRKSMLDVRIYEWISCSQYLIPSLSVKEASISFMKFHNVPEHQLSLDKISQTFVRMRKEVFEELKSVNQEKNKI